MQSFFLLLLLLYTVSAFADDPAVTADYSDEAMLFQEIPSVYGASKYEQKVTEAPSSVTIITSSDISKYGYRTLADILKSVRGFYVTYDRNYDYVGVRGFDRPGDYNTRILLLVDGHRTNDNIFDQAFIGTDFILDVDLIDRIEIIRGPGSSLYGNNAFFAVVNVITKRGRDYQGAEVSADAGSFQTFKERFTYGTRLASGAEILVSGSAYDSQGQEKLFFRRFDLPKFNNGIAEDADGDRFRSFFAKLSYADFTLAGAYITRDKDVPTAPFGTVFNNKTSTTDERGYLDLKYRHSFEGGWEFLARLYYDMYSYDGIYPFYVGAPGGPLAIVQNKDESRGEWAGSELNVSGRIRRHYLTAGAEYQLNIEQDQKNFDIAPYEEYLNDDRNSKNWALYIQDEYTILNNLILNAGVRYDHYDTFGGNTSPRIALIYTPTEKTTVKLLYGEAFRAPNAFEQYYQDGGNTSEANLFLKPEKIRTYELALNQYFGDRLLFTASGFYYRINGLITQELDPSNGLIQYRNAGTVKAKGFELEMDASLPGGIEQRTSYTFQETRDDNDQVLSNSPKSLLKLNLTVPVCRDKVFTSIEMQYTSNRKTLLGTDSGSCATANFTVFGKKIYKGLSASASVYDIFNRKCGDPASSEHREDTIEQDGITFRGKITYAF